MAAKSKPQNESKSLSIVPRRTSRRWRRMSLFSMACVGIAAGYLGYRVYLLAGPNGFRSVLHTQAAPVVIGCPSDGDEADVLSNINAFPEIPADYQRFISQQPTTGSNLIKNPAMTEIDNLTGDPTGFYRTIEVGRVSYALLYEEPGHKPFLRTVATKAVAEKGVAGGWIMNEIGLDKQAAYSYGFEYRATAPALVSVELRLRSGQVLYENVAELSAKSSWQKFRFYSPNLQQAKSFRFVVILKHKGQLDTRSYEVHAIAPANLDEGLVSIAFDDGWQSIEDKAWPLLQQYGFRTTQYIIGHASEHFVPGYMPMENLVKFKDAGHEIGSHTLDHCNQAKQSLEGVMDNAVGSKTLLEERDLGPVTSFAYPYGDYNQTTRSVISEHYGYIRSSDLGYNDRYFDTYNIHTMSVLNTTTEKQIKTWLDYAKKHRVWLVLTYHRVDEHGGYNVRSDQLIRQLELIKASGLKVLPVTEAAKSIR